MIHSGRKPGRRHIDRDAIPEEQNTVIYFNVACDPHRDSSIAQTCAPEMQPAGRSKVTPFAVAGTPNSIDLGGKF
jgi:hypothetical protein